MAYVLGCWYSDVTRSKKSNLTLNVRDEEFAREYNRCLCKVLGKAELYPIRTRSDGVLVVYGTSTLLWEFCRKSLEEHKSIIEAYPADFLRGFADGDGSARIYNSVRGPRSKNVEIKLWNTNREVLVYIMELLRYKFNITPTLREEHKEMQHPLHVLTITRFGDLLIWHSKIGFIIRRQQDKLEEIYNYISRFGSFKRVGCLSCGHEWTSRAMTSLKCSHCKLAARIKNRKGKFLITPQ